ncbi:MAG: peptidoglycan-binding protein [Candidatus Gracilibacteria bacterium]|nr:peptidoglycan-binding protein [Candidatus Gracilibacteria bacterium]
MKIKSILKLGVTNFLILAIGFTVFSPVANEVAVANDFSGSADGEYPYEDTFVISAYYSPLPCQQKYATGSYEADIRLNGHGIRGADGTAVYPGMIAAPKIYPFGTKMNIPGVGIVAVHDRGGAIVKAGERGYSYDRLDIWMGYGDKGLKRALEWGKRTVNVTVYGISDSVVEGIYLTDYSDDEYIPNECSYTVQDSSPSNTSAVSTALSVLKEDDETTKLAKKYNLELADKLSNYLEPGVKGENVRELQEELRRLNFYRTEPTGIYDKITEHAVFKFQQSQGIVSDQDEIGAGIFGPKTRQELNEIIASRNERRVLIAQASTGKPSEVKPSDASGKTFIASELDYGTTSSDVVKLQSILKEKGYFASSSFSEYYGVETREAVVNFQKDNGIISSESDKGAGRVGPSTLKILNSVS